MDKGDSTGGIERKRVVESAGWGGALSFLAQTANTASTRLETHQRWSHVLHTAITLLLPYEALRSRRSRDVDTFA